MITADGVSVTRTPIRKSSIPFPDRQAHQVTNFLRSAAIAYAAVE
jgi:hypothetical protein